MGHTVAPELTVLAIIRLGGLMIQAGFHPRSNLFSPKKSPGINVAILPAILGRMQQKGSIVYGFMVTLMVMDLYDSPDQGRHIINNLWIYHE